jgi:DNA-binding MarR family transcriptional regulator
MSNPKDNIDRIVDLWREKEPDLDAASLEVVGRILQSATRVQRLREQALKPLGLSHADFDVLATLLRLGGPEGVNPTVLSSNCMITSGAMTSRLDRLEGSGHIKRHPDPGDRRGVLIKLTREGESLARRALSAVFDAHEVVLADLSERDRTTAAAVLRKILVAAERA